MMDSSSVAKMISPGHDWLENLGCEKAVGEPGYLCDYFIDTGMALDVKEGTTVGVQHVQMLNTLLQATAENQGPSNLTSRARFVYVKSRGRWMKIDS